MFRVILSPIIKSACNYLQYLVFVTPLLLSAAIVEELEQVWVSCGWRTRSSNGVTNTRCCKYSCMRSWWWVEVPPKKFEQIPNINKLCNVASCCIYIGILLAAQYIIHISRISVNIISNRLGRTLRVRKYDLWYTRYWCKYFVLRDFRKNSVVAMSFFSDIVRQEYPTV
jgi:hypothetical protein